MALVRERHAAVRRDFEALLDAIARAKQDRINAANQQLIRSLEALRSAVAAEHWPSWLNDLHHHCSLYQNNHSNGIATWIAHLRSIIKNNTPLENERWFFGEEEDLFFDVDAIVDKARSEHNIDALFAQVIEALSKIADCDELDSLKACADLRRLIATLEKAKGGSFSSQVWNWQFARRLVPNIITAYVKRTSVTGPLIEAFEQTAIELNISLAHAKDQIGEDVLKAAAATMRTDCAAEIMGPLLYLEDFSSQSMPATATDEAAE